jgi:hypothetical protein
LSFDLYVEKARNLIQYSFFLLGNVDKAGSGKFVVIVYYENDENQFQPILIPIQIHPLPSNHIRISLSPRKIGKYRIYIAYRNIPINSRSLFLYLTIAFNICIKFS